MVGLLHILLAEIFGGLVDRKRQVSVTYLSMEKNSAYGGLKFK